MANPPIKDGLRPCCIARDLREKGFGIGEGPFVSQAFKEGHVERLSGEVASEAEQMDFEDRAVGTGARERGTEAEAADAAEAATIDHRFNRVDADRREKVRNGREVGCREAMGTREFASMHDGLADEVRASKHGLGIGEASVTDSGANARAGDRFAAKGYGLGDDYARPMLASHGGQKFRRTERSCAKAPVRAAVNFGDFA